jgi:branched-chain amino acid transport system permease protein
MSIGLTGAEIAQDLASILSLGATYALLALGLAIVFSILGMINFAHGELVTIAAYVFYLLAIPFVLQVPAALIAGAGAAVLMERLAFRPLRSAPFITTLFATFALSVIIQNLFLTVVSPRQRAVAFPEFFDGTFTVAGVVLSNLQVMTFVTCAVAVVVLTVFLKRTTVGLSMRAAAQDFDVTRLMGVNANRVIAGAFAVSGLLAAIAAIFIAARRGTVDPQMGFPPLLKAFIATVIGGMGSLSGAVLGGFVLATIEVVLDVTLPEGALTYRDAIALLVVIAILYFRPTGFLGRQEVTA